MAHLKKSAATGHLLRGSGGHLVNGECCPASLDITFSGVDAAKCTCHAFGGAQDLFVTDTLTVDGTYTVPLTGTAGDVCTYTLTADATFAGDGVQRKYLVAPCTNENLSQSPATSLNGTLQIRYSRSTQKVTSVTLVFAMDILQLNPDKNAPVFSATSLTSSLGVSISNALSCGDRTLSGGGTATVVITP